MSDNQRIKSGDESENYQASGDITVNKGLSFTEVKEVAMMVFENNFVKLGEQVEELVHTRADKLITDYLEKLRIEYPEAINNTIDPDIRAGIYEAQKDFVRSGKEDTEKLLVDLLIERTTEVQSDFKNIVMNEALSVASKLSKVQLDLLSISYLSKHLSFNQPSNPLNFVMLIEPFKYLFDEDVDSSADYTFLSYLGCMDISIGSVDYDKIIEFKNLIGLSNEEEIKNNLSNFPLLLKMKYFWNSNTRNIKNGTTTPVGNAIAFVNINRCLGYKAVPLDLS